jgi:hypothetical protein
VDALPGIRLATPGKTDQEKYNAGTEEDNADKVELLELLPLCLAVYMQLIVGRGMIKELVED